MLSSKLDGRMNILTGRISFSVTTVGLNYESVAQQLQRV